jgi:hypothetical protein
MKVRLEASNSGFAYSTEIPPFDKPPDVLMWGTRVFRYVHERIDTGLVRTHVYREAFAYHLVGSEAEVDKPGASVLPSETGS